MKHLTPAPWFEVQGVPCFKSNVRSSSAITEARRPVLLSRDDPQGREARFSHNGETRPKVLPIGELSWLHTERREEGIQARLPDSCNLFSLLKKLVKLAWREASSASRQSASLPSTRTGVSHTNDSSTMVAEVGGILSLFLGVSFMTIWDGAILVKKYVFL